MTTTTLFVLRRSSNDFRFVQIVRGLEIEVDAEPLTPFAAEVVVVVGEEEYAEFARDWRRDAASSWDLGAAAVGVGGTVGVGVGGIPIPGAGWPVGGRRNIWSIIGRSEAPKGVERNSFGRSDNEDRGVVSKGIGGMVGWGMG